MGLDQYAYVVMPSGENTDFHVTWSWDDASKVQLIAQWRKHANLQKYMEDLYVKKLEEVSKLEEQNDFNQQPLRLTSSDLDELESCVKEGRMPHGEGFFWGESTPEDDEETLKFVAYARRCLREGLEVYYDSWW